MEQMFKRTDTFLTHTWRQDLHNRDNHQRVAQVNEQLNKRGFVTWFDSKRMEGQIRDKMAEGVDFTSCVLVFITEEYMKKIDSGDNKDNCYYEYQRALMKKEKQMVCVVMETKFENPKAWFGRLKNDLGESLFVSMSGDLNNQLYLKQKMDELVAQLKLKDVTPSEIRKVCPSCKIHDENNTPIPLHGKGMYCTICKRDLIQDPEPRYYCGKCNLHRHGRYCSECKQDLIDPHIKITEIEDQYLKEVKLKTPLEFDQYPSLANKCHQEIENIQKELRKLQEKRSKAHSAGTKLFMDDKDYARKAEDLEETVASLQQTSSNLPISALECRELENAYNDDIQHLQEKMTFLAEKRNEISQRRNDLSRGSNACEKNLDLINKQIIELKSYGVMEETNDLPNQSHDKQQCKCELCTFENELTIQLKLDKGRDFLQALISDNDIHGIKTATKLRNEILHLTNDNRLNLLMSIILQNGSVDMMVALVKIGLQIESNELIQHIELGYGLMFLQKLMFDNKIDDLKKFASLYKEILILKNNEDLNLLVSLCFEHGTTDGLVALVEIGLPLDQDEIMKQVSCGSGEHYIRKLIVDNKTNELLTLISLCKETLLLTDKNGLNLLTTLTLQEGTFEMLRKLMEAGLQIDNFELMLQMKSDTGKKFIKKMIVDDKAEDVKQIATIWKDMLHLTNDDGSNLLLYLTFGHGTGSMLATLLEIGFNTDVIAKQFQLDNGQSFLKKLIVGNNIDDLKKLLSACKGLLHLEDDVGVNTLISLTLEYGRVDMLIMLLDTFFKGQADELMKKLRRLGSVKKLIRRLIISDLRDDVRLLVSTCKELVQTITENGFNVLLYHTVQHGTLGMFNMLVEAGMKVDVTPNVQNETYLHYTNNVEIAQMLCEKHEDSLLAVKDAIGCTSFMKSYMKNNIPLLNVMKPYVKLPEDEIKACESYNQVIQVYEKEGMEHLKQLINENDLLTMRILLMVIPEIVHTEDHEKYTPFLHCSRYGTVDMLKMLLEFGSDVLHRQKDGHSALHLAVSDLIINHLCCHFPELMTAEIDKQKFICKLITNNEIDNLKKLLVACPGFLHLENDDGVNMLISFTLEYGRVDMLIMLLDTFFQGQADQLMKEQVREGYVQKFIRRLITSDQIDEVRLLVSTRKELVQTITENGFNALLYNTVQHGTLGMFNMLVEAGVKVDVTPNVHNETYFHYTNNVEIAQMLVAVKDAIGCTSFMKAYINNNIPLLNMIKPYVKSPKDEIKACKSYNKIIQVYKKEGIEHIKQLIEKNDLLTMRTLLMFTPEMVHTEDAKKYTPFLYCSRHGTLYMLKMLLEFKSDVLHRNSYGNSALHLAVQYNKTHGELIINYLCSNFPELMTAENDEKYSPFLYCGSDGTLDMLKKLLEFGSDVLHRSKDGNSALHLAVKYNNKHGELIINYLCSNFPELMTAENDEKYTPFLYCSRYGTLDMLKMLLEFGSDVLHREKDGFSALHLAVMHNKTHGELIINYLCSNFPELMTAENNGGENVFHFAGWYNNENFVRILLQHTPPTTVLLKKNKDGRTPIDVANYRRDKTIVQMFNDYLNEHTSSTET